MGQVEGTGVLSPLHFEAGEGGAVGAAEAAAESPAAFVVDDLEHEIVPALLELEVHQVLSGLQACLPFRSQARHSIAGRIADGKHPVEASEFFPAGARWLSSRA